MRSRREERPYQELGGLLQRWRGDRYRSALAMVKEAGLSFSYSAYADFERGVTLPTVEVLLEIAKFHGVPAADAVFAWTRVQMPTPELKCLFQSREKSRVKPRASTPDADQDDAKGPNLDNTWVFTPKDGHLFERAPWLTDLLLRMVSAYPRPLSYKILGLRSKKSFNKLIGLYLREWLEQGHLSKDGDGLRLAKPHYHFPKTATWNAIRQRFYLRVAEGVSKDITAEQLDAGQAHRMLLNRTLSPAQRARWSTRIADLETEFLNLPYEPTGVPEKADEMFSFIMAFGRRNLELPPEIIQTCEEG